MRVEDLDGSEDLDQRHARGRGGVFVGGLVRLVDGWSRGQ
jgi:hypothetical protein